MCVVSSKAVKFERTSIEHDQFNGQLRKKRDQCEKSWVKVCLWASLFFFVSAFAVQVKMFVVELNNFLSKNKTILGSSRVRTKKHHIGLSVCFMVHGTRLDTITCNPLHMRLRCFLECWRDRWPTCVWECGVWLVEYIDLLVIGT